jgi:hypothetical protein
MSDTAESDKVSHLTKALHKKSLLHKKSTVCTKSPYRLNGRLGFGFYLGWQIERIIDQVFDADARHPRIPQKDNQRRLIPA